ncbi:VOC family protein [Clostridium sp. UBA6640]|uniref:VOC family protein n=1 Tax=Clostridium sp. UBA6640 TaxID=1946370 RepID=UPI0025B8C60A|nr:VOC family protein [Clostridium sp. UBA6640]
MIKSIYPTIFVKDMETSTNFYKKLLNLKEKRNFTPQPNVHIIILGDENNNLIEFIKNNNINSESSSKSNMSIIVHIENIDEMLDIIKSENIEILQGPVTTDLGAKIIFVKDMDGITVELIEEDFN